MTEPVDIRRLAEQFSSRHGYRVLCDGPHQVLTTERVPALADDAQTGAETRPRAA
ncbi:hypothetical protein [Actinoplanes sp. NBRC 101535]|uniref:hypothetical protein n=1 Tax=Actinoplanes sp. NBRC 101535 TaxID=3032196 RepID=UPI0025561CD8|nr:hypothetical protein [Actinoplanes sp. NBRC 101535]